MPSTRPIENYANVSFYLFIAAGIAGLIQLSFPVDFGAGFEMFAEAKSLAANGTFANPFTVADTGLTAVNPPLYPLFLALLMKILRVPALVMTAAIVGNIVANAVTAAALPRISVLFYGTAAPGVAAGLLWLTTAQLMPSWDISYTVAGLILFCLFTTSSINTIKSAMQSGALAGTAAGLLFLLNSATVLVSLTWIAYLVARRKPSLKEGARYCCALSVCLLISVSAWSLRNYHQLGGLVVRTNLGMTLYASNNDCAESSLFESERFGCYQAHHPNTSESEAQLLRNLGEVEYDRLRLLDAKEWASANPGRFWLLTARRVWEFWFPAANENTYGASVVWLITVFSIPGLIMMIRRRNSVTPFVLSVLLIHPLMYYLVVTDVRYRYPVLWLSLLPAGYSIYAIKAYAHEHWGDPLTLVPRPARLIRALSRMKNTTPIL